MECPTVAGSLSFPRKEPCQQKRDTPEKTHAANLSLGLMLQSRAIWDFSSQRTAKDEYFRTYREFVDISYVVLIFAKRKAKDPKRRVI